jgi:choline-sulfatase
VRAKYYAMIAEWDAMVGQYMQTVKDLGVWNQTVFIVTSDHGDMQMEKQQFYKMVPYDASASVPMVIYDGRPGRQFKTPVVVNTTTQLIDIFPTILELSETDKGQWPAGLDGESLVPMMQPAAAALGADGKEAAKAAHAANAARLESRPDFVVSQFHGDDIAMSWFLVVQTTTESTYKLIVWGSGEQHPALLFDLIADPAENHNLIADPQYAALAKTLDASLRSVVDYAKVAQQVAQYGHDSLKGWTEKTENWQAEIHKDGLRWTPSWNQYPNASMAAVKKFLNSPATINPCRSNFSWGPQTNQEN